MGLTITATNSEYEFNMGYGGFFSLRKNIAMAFDKDFGEIYANYLRCYTKRQFDDNDRSAELRLNVVDPDGAVSDVIDFLYQSDCSGKISHTTCKKIYDLIKDTDYSGIRFVYESLSDGKDYEHFKDFLIDCYSHRRQMRWC